MHRKRKNLSLIEFSRKEFEIRWQISVLVSIYEDEEWKRIESLPKCEVQGD